MEPKRVVIVGGGFAGVACALELSKNTPDNTKIVLISDKSHFEYHAALYRVVTGKSPLEVCIPLREIFADTDVELITDKVIGVDLEKQIISGESSFDYTYDYLVLTVGSETAYFDTPGLKELSFGFKSIEEALRLKRHLHESFENCQLGNPEEKNCATHIVVVGGGPSGTEIAGELAVYARELAKKHNIDPTLVTIELIQSPSRLVPMLPVDMSNKIETHLRSLGVNLYFNRRVIKEEVESVFLKDMQMKAKTVIWTSGVKPHTLYSQIKGLPLNQKGQVTVNKFLQAKGLKNVYIGGDAAETKYSGLAQTALLDGKTIGENLKRKLVGDKQLAYEPKEPTSAIPVGPDWAAVQAGNKKAYGKPGWWLRRWIDFELYKSILPFDKAVTAFRENEVLCETCDVCEPKETS